jgi:hypothetical protein
VLALVPHSFSSEASSRSGRGFALPGGSSLLHQALLQGLSYSLVIFISLMSGSLLESGRRTSTEHAVPLLGAVEYLIMPYKDDVCGGSTLLSFHEGDFSFLLEFTERKENLSRSMSVHSISWHLLPSSSQST